MSHAVYPVKWIQSTRWQTDERGSARAMMRGEKERTSRALAEAVYREVTDARKRRRPDRDDTVITLPRVQKR